ncbi:hypothetical protein [Pseudoxanthomonas sp. JBR18]|uniref:hypothetical protein n=1 Tax=Pseudoxanthomonas sp. JBR18 TaxID=2969308 RepID=UPI002305F73F|nr:hypothetical protein [Pseudoxanthomonas sp. JBR18]WCE05837.1 hypothetical protein PJ250_07780 [Pseudoxanthomonas sp. JBR18]
MEQTRHALLRLWYAWMALPGGLAMNAGRVPGAPDLHAIAGCGTVRGLFAQARRAS